MHPFQREYERGKRDGYGELTPELERLTTLCSRLQTQMQEREILDKLRWAVCVICIVIGVWGYSARL